MATTRKPTVGQRRISVTFDGRVFTARVEKFYVHWEDEYAQKHCGDIATAEPAWHLCAEGGWEQYKARWTSKKLLKAYRKAVAYVELHARLDREDVVIDAFGAQHAEYIEVH